MVELRVEGQRREATLEIRELSTSLEVRLRGMKYDVLGIMARAGGEFMPPEVLRHLRAAHGSILDAHLSLLRAESAINTEEARRFSELGRTEE
jgi:hypothetical protein